MFGFLSRIARAGASQLSQLSTTVRTASASLLSPATNSVSAVQRRNKCFDHYFLNRWMARDYKRRKLVKEYYPLRQRYIAIKRCSILPKELQEVASKELHEFPRDSNFTRLHPRCIFTSRPRWCIHRYRVSRIQWRLLADYNKMSGVLRACW
ncbi:hypothetical protein BsWGS_24254 [Bradybaena similaris]